MIDCLFSTLAVRYTNARGDVRLVRITPVWLLLVNVGIFAWWVL